MNEHFMEYNDILNRIEEIKEKIILLKENIYNVKGVKYSELQKSNISNYDITYQLAEIEELENKLEELLIKKKGIVEHLEKEIENVKNDNYRRILRMYYISKFNLFEIADIMNLSYAHIKKLKRNAINEFMKENDTKWYQMIPKNTL